MTASKFKFIRKGWSKSLLELLLAVAQDPKIALGLVQIGNEDEILLVAPHVVGHFLGCVLGVMTKQDEGQALQNVDAVFVFAIESAVGVQGELIAAPLLPHQRPRVNGSES